MGSDIRSLWPLTVLRRMGCPQKDTRWSYQNRVTSFSKRSIHCRPLLPLSCIVDFYFSFFVAHDRPFQR